MGGRFLNLSGPLSVSLFLVFFQIRRSEPRIEEYRRAVFGRGSAESTACNVRYSLS